MHQIKLSEIIDLEDSRRIPLSTMQRKLIPGDFPYYSANGIIDHINNYIFEGEVKFRFSFMGRIRSRHPNVQRQLYIF